MVSDRLLAIMDKIFTVRPKIRYRKKNRTHPTSEVLCLHSTLSQETVQV